MAQSPGQGVGRISLRRDIRCRGSCRGGGSGGSLLGAHRSGIAQRLADFARRPESMKEHGQLPCNRDDGPPPGRRSASFCEIESPPPQVGVRSEGPEDVVSGLHEEHAEHGISRLRGPQLRSRDPRLVTTRYQAQVRPHRPARGEPIPADGRGFTPDDGPGGGSDVVKALAVRGEEIWLSIWSTRGPEVTLQEFVDSRLVAEYQGESGMRLLGFLGDDWIVVMDTPGPELYRLPSPVTDGR